MQDYEYAMIKLIKVPAVPARKKTSHKGDNGKVLIIGGSKEYPGAITLAALAVSALRSGTSGRGAWFLQDQDFEKLPSSLQNDVVSKLRKRKGLPADLPRPILD